MNNNDNVYVFNPSVALEMAKQSDESEQIFFYDGEKLQNEPSNCIHVPIENFANYFLTSPYPYPQEINFDTMGFSADIQNTIIGQLSMALESVKTQRLQNINKLIETPTSQTNALDILQTFLEYIYVENLVNVNIPFVAIYKILETAKFLLKNKIALSQNNIAIIQKIVAILEKNPQTKKHFYLFHLKYSLTLLQNKIETTQEYFDALAAFDELQQFENDFILVKTLFEESELEFYLTNLAKSIFTQEFIDKDILKQKHLIYKLYYLTSSHYPRGKAFKTIFQSLKNTFELAIENQLDELAFYLYTPLVFCSSGLAQTQEEFKEFNTQIEEPLEQFIKEVMIPKYKIKENTKQINNKKIKVGFVQERLINYSVYNVFKLLIKSLKEYNSDQFEFIVYDLNFKEFGGSNPQTVEDLKQLGITYVDLHKECIGNNNDEFYSIVKKSLLVRRKLIKDKIDILIGMHSRPEYNFLFTTRTAPKQIYWSHGNFEYRLQNIDQYISHFQPDAEYGFYKDFALAVDLEKYNPPIDPELIKNTRDLYPKESFVLGSIGRMIKIDDEEYIKSVAAIMKTNPNTIYLACGDGDTTNIVSLLKKYSIEKRFYFTGRIDAHLYGYIIDLWLTPFKLGGGEAFQEFIHKKKPFVSLVNGSDEWIQEHENKLRRFVYPYSHEKYIEYASELIQNPDLAQEVTEIIAKEQEAYTNENNTVEQFIKSILD